MTPKRVVIAGLAGGLLLQAPGLLAIETGNPYSSIVARNAFALKPIPTVSETAADKAAKDAEPPPNLSLTGITVLSNQKKAYFDLAPTKPPNAPHKHLSLREGQKQNDLEVLEIRNKIGEVRIVLQGKEMTLDFKKNGGKLESVTSTGAPVPPGVRVPPVTLPGMERPGFQGRIPAPIPNSPPGFVAPTVVPPNVAPPPAQEFPGAPESNGFPPQTGIQPQVQSYGYASPINNGFQQPVNSVQQNPQSPQEPAVSFEQAIQNLEASREANAAAVAAGKLPPYPPASPSELKH